MAGSPLLQTKDPYIMYMFSPIISMLRNLKGLLGQKVSAAGIKIDQTSC